LENAARYIVYETSPWHSRAALLDDHYRLLNVRVDSEHRQLIEGAIVLGRVRKVQAGLNSAFVDIGDVVDAILPLTTIPDDVGKLHEGQALPVRVTRGSWGEKGARLSARVALNTDKLDTTKAPVLLKKAPDALNRCMLDAGDHPVKVLVTRRATYNDLLNRVGEEHLLYVTPDEPDYALIYALDEQLDSLVSDGYSLPGGGHLHVEHTQALTAIDIDLGNGRNAYEVNMAAVYEVVRLCRLLDLGGSVLVDFVTMKNKARRRTLTETLKELFAERDSHKVTVLPMSPFGLVEINRERRGPRLDALLASTRYMAGRICLELGRIEKPGATVSIEADLATIDVLNKWLSRAGEYVYCARQVELKSNPSWHQKFILSQN
jgi:Ribonuclease G/E